jgi:hypothetical protein
MVKRQRQWGQSASEIHSKTVPKNFMFWKHGDSNSVQNCSKDIK